MTRIQLAGVFAGALLLAGLVGCQPPDMSEMMKPPPRPAELDRLEMFVGRWEGTAEMRTPGSDEVMTSTGVDTVTWEADKWLLLERMEVTMGDGEGKMRALGVWTWDPKMKKYRIWYFDNWGAVGTATATYDEAKQAWKMKSKNHYLASGYKTAGEGTTRFMDDGTMEWNWSEWDSWKLMKFMELKGTSHRK